MPASLEHRPFYLKAEYITFCSFCRVMNPNWIMDYIVQYYIISISMSVVSRWKRPHNNTWIPVRIQWTAVKGQWAKCFAMHHHHHHQALCSRSSNVLCSMCVVIKWGNMLLAPKSCAACSWASIFTKMAFKIYMHKYKSNIKLDLRQSKMSRPIKCRNSNDAIAHSRSRIGACVTNVETSIVGGYGGNMVAHRIAWIQQIK